MTVEADAEAVVDYDRVIKGLEMLTRPHMQQYHGKNGRLKDLYPEPATQAHGTLCTVKRQGC